MLTSTFAPTTYYMSCMVDLPPLVARAAVQECLPDRIAARNGSVRLKRCAPVRLRDDWLLATAPAALARGVHRLRVEVELTRWSSERSELGLRPVRWYWTTWPTDGGLAAGHAILAELGRRMQAWADAPLRDEFAASQTGLSRADSAHELEPAHRPGSRFGL